MTRTVVVCDASVALAWLQDESAPRWVPELWDAAVAGDVIIRVPTMFWLEVGNRLVRQPAATDEQVLEGLIRLEDLAFESVEMDRPLRLMAVHLARQHGLSTYDALYLALADASDATLATLDRRLGAVASATGRRFGEVGGSTVHEDRVPYGTSRPGDPMSLAALGAYLAELRDAIPADG